jgi:GTP-binding protein EngB required for normal cell division
VNAKRSSALFFGKISVGKSKIFEEIFGHVAQNSQKPKGQSKLTFAGGMGENFYYRL